MKEANHICHRLRAVRLDRGLTQRALAEQAGLTNTCVSRIENGHITPSLKTLLRLCHALGTSPNALLGWTRTRI